MNYTKTQINFHKVVLRFITGSNTILRVFNFPLRRWRMKIRLNSHKMAKLEPPQCYLALPSPQFSSELMDLQQRPEEQMGLGLQSPLPWQFTQDGHSHHVASHLPHHCTFNHCTTLPHYCVNTTQESYLPVGVIFAGFLKYFGDYDKLNTQVRTSKTKMEHLP